MSLEIIIADVSVLLFNNVAQVWHHTFLWQCLSPQGGGESPKALTSVIEELWVPVDTFKAELTQQALNYVGSGWTWL